MSRLSPEARAELEASERRMIESFSDIVREAITQRCQIAAIDGNWVTAAEDLTRYCAEQIYEYYG